MAFPTFDHLSDAGGEKSPVLRSQSTEFGDGYYQVVFTGRHKSFEKLTLTFTGEEDETRGQYQTLLSYAMNLQPFYYRFNGIETAKLYTVDHTSLSLRHISGLKWSLSVVFTEWGGIS